MVHSPEWTTGSFDCMEKTTIIAGGFLNTKKPARRACWLAIKVENLLGQALPLGFNQVALLAVVDAHAGVP